MTQAEYARHRGCSREAVRKAIDAGRIVAFGPDKLVDRELADTQWKRNTRTRISATPPGSPAAQRSPEGASQYAPPDQVGASDGGDGDYWKSRARREMAEAELSELKLAEQRGVLVRVADVRTALSTKASALREAFLQLPARLAPVLAAESDQARCHDLLQTELRQVLEQFTTATAAT
jgi:hypothetical protein